MRGKTDANGLAAQATSRWPPATFPSLFPRNRVAFWSSSKAFKSSISGGAGGAFFSVLLLPPASARESSLQLAGEKQPVCENGRQIQARRLIYGG